MPSGYALRDVNDLLARAVLVGLAGGALAS
jgi:hypothetical protein